MSDNSKRIKKVIKLLSQFSKQQNKLEKALEKLEWPMDLFFISLTNEILIELEKNDIQNQTPTQKIQKRGSILNINIKLSLDKPEKKYLYQLINIFDEIKKYKETLKEEIIEYIITPENIQKILMLLMSKNKNTSTGNNNASNEMNEFNIYIMELLINIINLNNKILIGALSSESQYNVFCQLFIFFSKTEENRNLLYELERNIFLYYPQNNNLKEIINYTINCIDEELEMNKNCCKKRIGEIKQILFLYKNDINIINKEMSKLIINIFKLFENEIGKHNFINDFLKFCFNEICFNGNNKFYSRYNFTSANKSKTMNTRSSNLYLGNNSNRNSQISNSVNSNIKNNNNECANGDNTYSPDNNNNINENTIIIKSSKTQNSVNNNDNKINNEDESKIKDKEDNERDNKYNLNFINFLFDIYQELINLKLKNSYSIFFIELFLSINNSNEGKKEYLFLINNTNYIKIILPSLLQLKDESLIAVYFSKIIFLSISDNNNINDCYSPEIDLKFFINNINLFLDDKEDKNTYNVISSQIMNLIKMNNNVIDIILNKCNIYEVLISIINNDKYNIEVKRKIIEFLETVHYINNNKFKYKLKIPIINYNIDDNNLIKKIYLISLIYENDETEFSNKIILIINYMNSLFSQNLIQELIVFFDILLDGINKNILQISNTLIIDDENINKLNNLLMEFSMFKNDYLKMNICDLIFILLKFEFNYNKKYMIYNSNKISSINKNKIIIDYNTIYMIIKNFLMIENQYCKKIKLLDYIFKYCLDYNDQIDLIFDEYNEEEVEKEKNKPFLIKAPNILVKIVNILYQIKDYHSIDYIINKIIFLIEYSSLNIKIIINNNNLIHIITKLFIELFPNKNEEKLFTKINCLLNTFIKYLSESFLISYISDIYYLFYNTIISPPNTNETIHNKKIILELYNLLKNGLTNSKYNNYEFLSISNSFFYNPFIYNSFFIKELNFETEFNIFICLNINLRISTYNNIGIFYLAEFINQINNSKLLFYITNEKILKVEEKTSNKNKIMLEIKNVNDILPDDGNFHKVAIIINVRTKKIYFDVDQEKMKLFDINSCKYNSFQFDEFDIFLGYKPDSVKSKLKLSKLLSNIPIIDIKNIMLTKFNNFEEYNLINNTKRSIHINDILLENINKDKKYFDNNNNKEIQKSIIIDIFFKNKNINIIKSKKIKNEIQNLKEYLSNDIFQNKYISYYNIFSPNNINTINNCNIHIYMLSLVNNIEEYYCQNNSSNIVFYNINKKYLQSKIFDNYNTASSACNYTFIDYLISFFFDIEKRRNKIMNQKEMSTENNDDESENENLNPINEVKDEKIEIFDPFLIQIILIIFELIINLPNKEIINYFLYENNIFSIKLKNFFSRNIYLFNENNEFIQKIFGFYSKSSILEEENKSIEFVLVFASEIFLDLFIFQKLNNKAQNNILTELFQILNDKSLPDKEYINKNLYKILKQIYKISIFSELSTNQIDFKLDDINNPTQIDIILKCIKSLFNTFENNKNKEFIDKIIEINHDINNMHCKFKENILSHNVKNFNEENKDLIESKILFKNDLIFKQMEELVGLYSKSKIKNFDIENKSEEENSEINKSLISIISNTSNNSNENKLCWFCKYLNIYFKNKFDSIYNQMKFDKIIDNHYINIFLNFNSYRNVLGTKNYSWFLSRNEGSHKIQNKFFLKKNDILQKKCSRKKLNGETFTYKYLYDKQKYESSIKTLYRLFLFDNICKDSQLINIISEVNNNDNDNVENCLYIKNIHRTLSVIILLKDSILILTNICLDNYKKLHVVKSEIDATVWCVNKESYENELEQFISKNDQDILKELINAQKGSNKSAKGFEYNRSYSFSYIKLLFKNISELQRTSYLTVPNSIEIFMKNGKSHFICLSLMKREKIFMDIINKMNEFYRNKEMNENTDFYKKNNKNVSYTDNFYMKYCPLSYLLNNSKEYNNSISFGYKLSSSARKKANSTTSSSDIPYNKKGLNINHSKGMITPSIFLSEVTELWTKSKVSNFDYINLLNILSGRSLNNLSQYFIFPRLLNDFNHSIFNWMSSSIYRDFSYSIIASDPENREDVKKKYETSSGEKYHSGTFYSTYAFVAYFLIRQRPFSEISLEIQGGEFDATDRLFIGAGEICGMRERYQESIPSLMTLPETYINNNKYNFGKRQSSSIYVNDFEMPNWSKDDPRKFSLVIKRILENKNINIKLNKWFDIIFGVGQTCPEAIKFMNVYRKACYELSLEEIEELNKKFELPAVLLEKQELGYMAKQIFKKPHKKKENINEYIENENMFFDTNLKLRKIKFSKINNAEYNKEKDDILFSSINDFLFDIDNNYIKNTNTNNNAQGGIASLKSIMKAFDDVNNNILKNNNPLKLVNVLEKANKFIILGKGYYFLGKKYDYILSHSNKYLEIINYKLNIYFCYYLNETNNISTLAVNDKGNKIYVAFNNGNILEYKIIFEDEEIVKENKNIKNNNIYPFLKSNTVDKMSLKFKDYYYYNFSDENADKSFVSIKRTDTKKSRKKSKTNKNMSPPVISLKKNSENNFTFNNPHNPEKIIKLKLNEENQVLIAITISNLIYLISLNHKFKLMHIINYYSNFKFQYKIKDIITFAYNGDFIIYSSMTVHLFSINGVPLCELNLIDKVHETLSQITCCNAIFLYDVILFTGHEDFSIVIWRVKNKNTMQNFNERVSYVYNNNNSKFFLNEYYYNYDFDIDNNNNYNIQECELRRKFEIVSQIKMEEDLISNNLSIDYMKMSQDMSYMIILDNKKDVYVLSNFDDYKEDANSNTSNNSLNKYPNSSSSANIFGHFKDKKMHCISCLKEIEDNYYNASMIKSFKGENDDDNDINTIDTLFSSKMIDENNYYINSIIDEKDINKNNIKETNYICEECKLKLFNTENYLYNY